jgi:hypothetical protein
LPFAPIGDSMPFVENQGAKLYWDEQGSGEPLLLIMASAIPPTCGIAAARFSPTVIAPSLSIIVVWAKAMSLQASIPSR